VRTGAKDAHQIALRHQSIHALIHCLDQIYFLCLETMSTRQQAFNLESHAHAHCSLLWANKTTNVVKSCTFLPRVINSFYRATDASLAYNHLLSWGIRRSCEGVSPQRFQLQVGDRAQPSAPTGLVGQQTSGRRITLKRSMGRVLSSELGLAVEQIEQWSVLS
jgi:hypothetical protein